MTKFATLFQVWLTINGQELTFYHVFPDYASCVEAIMQTEGGCIQTHEITASPFPKHRSN